MTNKSKEYYLKSVDYQKTLAGIYSRKDPLERRTKGENTVIIWDKNENKKGR